MLFVENGWYLQWSEHSLVKGPLSSVPLCLPLLPYLHYGLKNNGHKAQSPDSLCIMHEPLNRRAAIWPAGSRLCLTILYFHCSGSDKRWKEHRCLWVSMFTNYNKGYLTKYKSPNCDLGLYVTTLDPQQPRSDVITNNIPLSQPWL